MPKMIALRPLTYATRRLQAGDEFDAKDNLVRALVGLKRARLADGDHVSEAPKKIETPPKTPEPETTPAPELPPYKEVTEKTETDEPSGRPAPRPRGRPRSVKPE